MAEDRSLNRQLHDSLRYRKRFTLAGLFRTSQNRLPNLRDTLRLADRHGSKVPARIIQLVTQVPELYQPVFSHPEFDTDATRSSDDRREHVYQIFDALKNHLNRRVRVLDLGCAQGFFSLSLAARGAEVLGIDRNPENIELCNALAAENPDTNIRFQKADIEDTIEQLPEERFDLVLGMSVFHHLYHEHGIMHTRRLMAQLASGCDVLLCESALQSEPVYWAELLPDDPRDLLRDFAFVHQVSEHETPLTKEPRPFYFCSNAYWFLGGELEPFESWTDQQHEVVKHLYLGTRRYYFSGAKIAKHFLLHGERADLNRSEIESEAAFLSSPPSDLTPVPRLYASGFEWEQGWLVRELLPGRRLSELIREHEDYNASVILRDILQQLVALECAGLYHNDVRVWNVLITPGSHACLIDFGSISRTGQDVVWPDNLFLSFLSFSIDVLHKRLPYIDPTRPPLLTASNFPMPYGKWAAEIWAVPAERWSFRFFLEQFDKMPASDMQPATDLAPSSFSLWLGALEKHLDQTAQFQNNVQEHLVYLDTVLKEAEQDAEELKRAHATLHRFQAIFAGLQTELNASRDYAIQLSGELSSQLSHQLSSQLSHQVSNQLSTELSSQFANQLDQFRIELAQPRRSEIVLEAKLADAHRECEHWRQRAATYENECRSLRTSRSWKLTEPVRKLINLFAPNPPKKAR